MKNELVRLIESNMEYYLNEIQIVQLNESLKRILNGLKCLKRRKIYLLMNQKKIMNYWCLFFQPNKLRDVLKKTIDYYKNTIFKMFESYNLKIKSITTDDLRKYLANYKNQSNSSKSTIDNIRRVLSIFFSQLEDGGYI